MLGILRASVVSQKKDFLTTELTEDTEGTFELSECRRRNFPRSFGGF